MSNPPMQHIDPRWFQIGSLGSLLFWGTAVLGFGASPARIAAIIGTALLTQLVCTALTTQPRTSLRLHRSSGVGASRSFALRGETPRPLSPARPVWQQPLTRAPRFEWMSALISGLGLCFLLRSNDLRLILLGAVLAIGSKFAIRWRGKHVFNPTNFAIVLLLATTDRVWVSAGQWGSAAVLAFAIACAGVTVVQRSRRSDVTFAFLAAWTLLQLARAVWLGDPLSIPMHRLENGAMLIFAFFMISDPKTTPDSRAGRILFAATVALGGFWIQYALYRTNGLLWSLFACSPLVPLIDRFLPAARFDWRAPAIPSFHRPFPKEVPMFRAAVSLVLVALLVFPATAEAFCGFYVAKGDAKLFNKASQVVLVRDDDRTVLTMASDYEGDPREFALVVPVPTLLERGQIRVVEKKVIDHLDAYTAPRLVEYHDDDPCLIARYELDSRAMPQAASAPASGGRAKILGVTIEASYTVGEYDILILSAKESSGLETWLRENGYKIPSGASEVLGSYIRQKLRFFVAKVNLDEKARLGVKWLRPIQVAYESPRFGLPIRLGTVNAKGAQDLFIYALTRTGRVETTNYRTVRLPSDVDLPVRIRDDFPRFYKAMFSEQVRRAQMQAVFLEYAWDMAWCDPCAADPLSNDELRRLGVFWIGGGDGNGAGQNVFVTRLHVRYDEEHFPDDLVLQETGDRSNFQARYVLRHPWTGVADCSAAREYREELAQRQAREERTLAELTRWAVRRVAAPQREERKWWEVW